MSIYFLGYFPQSLKSSFDRTKKGSKDQKEAFTKLNSQQLNIALTILESDFDSTTKLSKAEALKRSQSLYARLVHLDIEEDTLDMLRLIFAGEAGQDGNQRHRLDDSSLRTKELWNRLAGEFFNSKDWGSTNENMEFVPIYNRCPDDARLSFLEPGEIPETPLSGSDLRTMYNSFKSDYTRLYHNYHRSGQLVEGEDHAEGDDEFFTKYADNRPELLYAHILYGRSPPSHILRTLPEDVNCDVGVNTPAGPLRTRNSQKKRQIDKGDFDVTEITNSVVKALRVPTSSSAADRRGEIEIAETNQKMLIDRISHFQNMIDRCKDTEPDRLQKLIAARDAAEEELFTFRK
jgi:hypothetical protein